MPHKSVLVTWTCVSIFVRCQSRNAACELPSAGIGNQFESVGSGIHIGIFFRRLGRVQVLVRDNNVDQALKVLKKKMQREGLFREMKLRNFYEKPSERRAREKAEAVRRARKLARKRAEREGLLPSKPKKPSR
jgi:small subunit ribosomal protein S21